MSVAVTMRWRLSPAHLRAVLLGVAGVTAATLFRAPVMLVLATPFAIVAVWSTATRPGRDPTVATRLAPTSVREGEATTWTATISDAEEVDHVVVRVPRHPWIERRPTSGALAAPGGSAAPVRLTVALRMIHWGHQTVGTMDVVAVSAWGAFRWAAIDRDHEITALPLPAVFDTGAPLFRGAGLIGVNRSARPGDGTDFAGIRPFQTGDRLRRVNWRRTTRDGELRVTATHADQDTHVALLVDAASDHGPSGGIDAEASSLDTAVRAAGAVAEHLLTRGERVSLRVLGGRKPAFVPPAGGSGHLRRILDVLATVEPGAVTRRSSAHQVAPFPGDSLVITLSPLISPDVLNRVVSIARHGLDVAVIDTLPADLLDDGDPETRLAWRIRLLERGREVHAVRQVGVPVVEWRGPGSLDPFLRGLARRASAPRLVRR